MTNTWEHTVSIHFVKVLLENTKADGRPHEKILEDAQIRPELLAVRDARITSNQLATAIATVTEIYEDELMGLSADPIRSGIFSLATKYAIQASTLDGALYRWAKFYTAVTDALQFDVLRSAEYTDIVLNLNPHSQTHEPMLTEYIMLVTHRLSSWLIGQFIPLERASFQYDEPWYSREYQLMYSTPCEFSAESTSIRIPNNFLQKPIVQTKDSLHQYFTEIPGVWFKRQDYHQQTAGQVVRALTSSDQLRGTQITDIAQQLNITDRTLRRRLIREGTSFQTLKDNFRRDKAIELLAKSSLTVAEIAVELGFAEPNAFTRAFKQWTGSTPKSYRQY